MAGDSTKRLEGLSAAKQALLRARLQKAAGQAEHAIPRRGERQAPLSFAQQRLWFLDQFDPHSCAYNVARVFRLFGKLDIQALESAVNAIVERHEVLRTTYRSEGGEPFQRVNEPRPVPLRLLDFAGLSPEQQERKKQEIIRSEGTQPFDLSSDLLLRVTLLKLQQNAHILVLMTHHIASDGWSKGVLFHELASFYNAFASAQPALLPDLALQYSDFSSWQRDWVKGKKLQNQLSYWKKQLDGAPSLLELPTDFPRPPMQGFEGATESRLLPAELGQQIKAFSQREGTTTFITLLAAFHVLLSRYSRQEETVVGIPIAGRNLPELEPLIGDFVNMLAMRNAVGGDPSFRQFVHQVKETALQAYDNQDLPFEMLVDEIEHGREMSRATVFQSIFILETAPPVPPAMRELAVEILEFDPPTAKNDLILILADEPRGLKAKLEYRTDLFTKSTAERFLRSYQKLLEGIVADPERTVGALPILSPEEHELLIDVWNQTSTPEALGGCMHQLLEEQCERTPDAIAVRFHDAELSYAELNRRANQLAHYLIKRGIEPDARVGLCLHRSLEMMVGLIGIMKAGGAYVPLDPAYPRERLEFMLQDAGAKMVVTKQELLETVSSSQAQIICLDRDRAALSRESEENPRTTVASSNLCYVIYTSGSTGRPKGVQLEHGNVTNFVRSMQRRVPLGPVDVYFGVASMSFDASVMDFYFPLSVGATLVISDANTHRDAHSLAKIVNENSVTAMHATPSTWRSLLDAGWRGNEKLTIFSGGEALPWEVAKALLPCCSELWNLYGPTETAVYSTIHRVSATDGAVFVGQPIGNTQIYVLDGHKQPTPVGVPGEICIAGAGVARGYFNRASLNAEKFVEDPFRPGQCMYRTGDLGRFRSDGILECLGRLDHQVKLRGFRIELGEIESVLMQVPGVRQAAVDVRTSKAGDKRLLAYLVTENGEIAVSEIRRSLGLKLPEYMVPSAFVTIDALPLSPNGKLNRSALPDPGEMQPAAADVFVAPATPVEKAIAEIFSQVLEVPIVGRHDNFFELGGHSLLATRVVSRLRDKFQLEVTPRALFESPTVGQMAERISALLMQSASDEEMAAVLAELGGLGDE